jgi:hypothetical protein
MQGRCLLLEWQRRAARLILRRIVMSGNKLAKWLLIVAACALCLICAGAVRAQDQEGSKSIESKEVVERPVNTTKTSPSGTKSRRRVTYSSSKPFTKRPTTLSTEFAAIGVTIRRLQVKDGSKDLEQEGEEAQLEQVETGAPLIIGSRVRIYLEPLMRAGFLYVIDREQFADGTYGTPRLIFPTLRTRNGNNQVRVNELIQIPRPPSYFRINPSSSGKTQVAEVLTIIIARAPLELPTPLGEKAMTLNAEQVKEWERKWSSPVTSFEMEGGAGQATGAKDLDQVGEEAELKENDPLPETVYRATIITGNPLLLTVPLRFKPAAASSVKHEP